MFHSPFCLCVSDCNQATKKKDQRDRQSVDPFFIMKEGDQLTNEELVSLIQQGENVSENMGILYQQNIDYIQNIVKRYNMYVENDDLMQEAYFSLKETVDNCDLSIKNIDSPFMALLKKVLVRRSMKLVDKNSGILSFHFMMSERIRKYNQLKSKCGTLPDKETVMRELNLSNRQYNSLMEALKMNVSVSMDKAIYDDELSLSDVISSGEDVEETVINADAEEHLKTTLWNQVEQLDEYEKTIINLYYKLNLTNEDIAMNLGFSRNCIIRKKLEALSQLRKMEKIQELAEQYGYNCSLAYKSGLQDWKKGKGSSVERLVIRKMEYEEQYEQEKSKLLQMVKGNDVNET